ncbi:MULTISPECIES: polysaccharide biosynthesis protein [Petrotoga]|uniref:FlaA1/EpsC-like NDP-sugar epimerase n=4 Tax=Petrotoga TaxID=28236 RepID=A0A4R8EUM0_9BACT|nr:MULTISPECIES: nucleoside-diphosphate sugar epimerase/dehydratase [Petrotoga]PNR94887.1 polysaccharide biosynthesis protein CapD [Petrotoga olearia DSM 13574]POZ87942.1 polysaccharide biosynthesis protein [Petrotoga sibirica DSM 13575]RMA73176.1 FlaA1/EpsC-like NDP-sugar epimerase [Petrotoga olearia]TDX16099.1 FlaA1/EpsC-like NDP-sugar epimerase [Petrotoga sibirica]
MKHLTKRSFRLMIIDYILFFLAYIVAMFIRFQFDFVEMRKYISPIFFFPLIMVIVFYYSGIYRYIWRFATLNELRPVFNSGFIGFLINFFVFEFVRRYISNIFTLPFSVAATASVVGVVFVSASRIYWFSRHSRNYKKQISGIKNILIIGAGDAGTELLGEYERHPEEGSVVGFLDDDPEKIGRNIRGYPVLGKINQVMDFLDKYNVEEVIIAIPSASSDQIKKIIDYVDTSKVRLKTLPGILEILDNKLSLGFLREVDISDLLGRKEVSVDLKEIKDYIKGKKILVTGAGGSIGSEICRQVMPMGPKALFLLGKGENSIFEISNELKDKFSDAFIEELIADVSDENRMRYLFSKYGFDVVFHAAAHKHVPLMQKNPTEAFKINTIGTYTVAKLSGEYNAERFVFISTDKAIKPTSIMGASKRLGEIIVKTLSNFYQTKYGIVRFGNVLGSRGSVIPIFKEQIQKGGPVTVTHPNMKRYFMTIPEAVSLVLQCGQFAQKAEIFVLEMGEPVNIDRLARDLIRLSGYIPDQDIKIVYTGIRPGEKLYEEIFLEDEDYEKTRNKRIFISKSNNHEINKEKLNELIDQINIMIKNNDYNSAIEIIKDYIPDSNISKISEGTLTTTTIKQGGKKL